MEYMLICEDSDCGYSIPAKPNQYSCTCPECGESCDPMRIRDYEMMITGGLDSDAFGE